MSLIFAYLRGFIDHLRFENIRKGFWCTCEIAYSDNAQCNSDINIIRTITKCGVMYDS